MGGGGEGRVIQTHTHRGALLPSLQVGHVQDGKQKYRNIFKKTGGLETRPGGWRNRQIEQERENFGRRVHTHTQHQQRATLPVSFTALVSFTTSQISLTSLSVALVRPRAFVHFALAL